MKRVFLILTVIVAVSPFTLAEINVNIYKKDGTKKQYFVTSVDSIGFVNANAKWGGEWRIPTVDEVKELRDIKNCIWSWSIQNDVEGFKVTSRKNANSIFIPTSGYYSDSKLESPSSGYYWINSLDPAYSELSYNFHFHSKNYVINSIARKNGLLVRPVLVK